MQANYYDSVLKQDPSLDHLTFDSQVQQHVKVKTSRGVKNIPVDQYYQSSQVVQQMKILQPQNQVQPTICQSGGQVNFDIKQGIGNAHTVSQFDLVIQWKNTENINTASNIALLPAAQFLSPINACYFSDGSDNVSAQQSSFALSFMSFYNIPSIIENSALIEYRNYQPDAIGANYGVLVSNQYPQYPLTTYTRVRNPYRDVLIRQQIKGDFHLTFNFQQFCTYYQSNTSKLQVQSIYLILTTQQLPQNQLMSLIQNPVCRVNPIIITKYLPLQQTLTSNNNYSVKVDFNKSIFGIVWYIQGQNQFDNSSNPKYQNNQALTYIDSYDLTDDSGQLISSHSNMKYTDLNYWFEAQLKNEFLLNKQFTLQNYWFCNDPQRAITDGGISSLYSLKDQGLNINFVVGSAQVSQVPQQLCVMLFCYAENYISDGRLIERLV